MLADEYCCCLVVLHQITDRCRCVVLLWTGGRADVERAEQEQLVLRRVDSEQRQDGSLRHPTTWTQDGRHLHRQQVGIVALSAQIICDIAPLNVSDIYLYFHYKNRTQGTNSRPKYSIIKSARPTHKMKPLAVNISTFR